MNTYIFQNRAGVQVRIPADTLDEARDVLRRYMRGSCVMSPDEPMDVREVSWDGVESRPRVGIA